MSQGQTPEEAAAHRNQGIPGLAFKHSGLQPETDASWSHASSQAASRQGSASAPKAFAVEAEATHGHESVEEGEISEEDMEDLYDDEDAEADADAAMSDEDADARERSGSYSPYLSPREIDSPPSQHASPSKRTTLADELSMKVQESKTAALEAIRRLQRVQVGYGDYAREGVDRDVLNGLLQELGIHLVNPQTTESSQPSQPIAKPTTQATKPDMAATKAATAPDADGSESRKDRIARLLAKKKKDDGEKPPASTQSKPAKPTVITPSERSKLLRQKIEALSKAREALQKSAVKPTETGQISSNDDSDGRGDSKKRNANQLEADVQAKDKRGFGEKRPSRPLLIDVSEDEDDMDLEDAHVPVSSDTPMSGVGASDNEELLSMHKRIEAMKQKIAEAEAKKKARELLMEMSGMSEMQDTESNSPLQSVSASLHGKSPETTSAKLPGTERSRYNRASSERLPAVEAHRREKQLRLKLLQSQVAMLQQEIETSFKEEERLKSAPPTSDDEEGAEGAPVALADEIVDNVVAEVADQNEPEASDDDTSGSSDSDEDEEEADETSQGGGDADVDADGDEEMEPNTAANAAADAGSDANSKENEDDSAADMDVDDDGPSEAENQDPPEPLAVSTGVELETGNDEGSETWAAKPVSAAEATPYTSKAQP